MNNFNPQLFIWLGDNIYADNKRPVRIIGKERTYGPWRNSPRFSASSIQEMEEKYSEAKKKPGYMKLCKNARVQWCLSQISSKNSVAIDRLIILMKHVH